MYARKTRRQIQGQINRYKKTGNGKMSKVGRRTMPKTEDGQDLLFLRSLSKLTRVAEWHSYSAAAHRHSHTRWLHGHPHAPRVHRVHSHWIRHRVSWNSLCDRPTRSSRLGYVRKRTGWHPGYRTVLRLLTRLWLQTMGNTREAFNKGCLSGYSQYLGYCESVIK